MSSCRFSPAFLVGVVLVAAATAPLAQPAADGAPSRATAPAGSRDPGDAKAAVPGVRYSSAFARYRPNTEAELGSWRSGNDNVGRIGGWRVYGKEASEPEVAGRPTKEAAPSPAAPAADAKPQHGQKR